MENENFLKGTGTLMILGGVIAILTAIAMLPRAAAMAADAQASMLGAAALLMLVCGFEAIVAGYAGVKHRENHDKIADCIAWAVVVSVLGLGGALLAAAATGSVNVVSIALSILLPVLYIMGANANRQTSARPLAVK